MSHSPPAQTANAAAPAVTELLVDGMTCQNCARHVTEAIQGVPGVRHASVTLAARRASVRWNENSARNIPAVVTAIQKAGYAARPAESTAPDHADHHENGWHFNLWIGGIVTGALMLGEWVFGLGMTRWFQWLALALAGGVQIFCGAQFYRGAWRQLKIGSSNMDTLVALGSTTAFGYSTGALLAGLGGHLYFMEAAAIITLISLGHWVEARVSERASGALKALLNLAPQTARKLIPSGGSRRESALTVSVEQEPNLLTSATETEVPITELRTGDLVALRPGDRVPTDGKVVEGNSAVDESMLTGESVPVDKSTPSELYAGTINLNGRLTMRVTATGEATALANIIAAVQRAQTSRANIQRIGDRVSNVFVPVVVAIAIIAGLWWGFAPESARQIHETLQQFLWHAHPPAGVAAGFIIAAAVLIIACPCAMGLATPAAIMAGANAAARRGILIRDGVALEKAGEVTAVVFDKTGTLTIGKPAVVQAWHPLIPSLSPPRSAKALRGGESDGEGLAEDRVKGLAASLALIPFLSSSDGERVTEGRVRGLAASLALIPSLAPSDGERVAEGRVRGLAASLARHSTHPVSLAIAAISTGAVQLSDWQEIRGAGVAGNLQPSTFNHQRPVSARLGALRWLRESGVDLSPGDKFIAAWTAQGATVVGLALENSLAGLFAVRDTVKPGAEKVVGRLQSGGLRIFLLTGDNAGTAASIARQLDIPSENVFAEVKPEQKADFIKKLQARGERVAFVGDGINDAPALTQADLGIAVSRASDVAREAADIILLKSEIEAVPEALGLARATLRTIKQNLFWAFFYNAVGVPLAALGFMSPVLCAAAMGFSDLIVIGNALRLARWRST